MDGYTDSLHDIIREQERVIRDKTQHIAELNLVIAQLKDKVERLQYKEDCAEQPCKSHKKTSGPYNYKALPDGQIVEVR